MKNNSFFFLLVLLCMGKTLFAQNIGIGTNTPNASALLDISSNSKGFLIPRVSLVSETDVATVANPAISLLVFNTNSSLPTGEGYYFWNANKWIKLATNSNVTDLTWGISGNSGTNAGTNFIGTTDNKALVFKTNNIMSGLIAPGSSNVFFGQSAGVAVTSGMNNSFFGHLAGRANSTGNANLFAGFNAGAANTESSGNVFLGAGAGQTNTIGSENVYIGKDAGLSNVYGADNVFIGNGAGRNKLNSYNIAIGKDALSAGTTAANYNIAIGHGAGFAAGNPYTLPRGGGIYIGTGAGYNAKGGIAIGDSSCKNCDTGEFATNIAIGQRAMIATTTGSQNTVIGVEAMLSNNNGEGNTAIGFEGMRYNVNGDYNTAIGYRSGPTSITPNLSNTTAVGYNALVTSSNTMVFGNFLVDRWAFGIPTTSLQHALEVGINSSNGNGAYLTQGGTWTNTSDIHKKEDFSPLDKNELLQKIAQLSIQRWKYKGTDEYHIGPTAQEFYKLFNVGADDKGISTVDPAGIALAAIQEQQKIMEKQNDLILKLEKRIETLEKK